MVLSTWCATGRLLTSIHGSKIAPDVQISPQNTRNLEVTPNLVPTTLLFILQAFPDPCALVSKTVLD